MRYPKMVHEEISRKQFGKVIIERKFELPSGKVIDYFNWGGTTIPSIIFPVTPNKEVVALKQFRYGINNIVVELPGGCPFEDETAKEIARKELEEETGYSAESFTNLGPSIWFEPANCTTPYVPILATGCQKICEPQMDETEFAEVILYPLLDWIKKIHDGEIRDSKSIAVTFLALPHLGVKLTQINNSLSGDQKTS